MDCTLPQNVCTVQDGDGFRARQCRKNMLSRSWVCTQTFFGEGTGYPYDTASKQSFNVLTYSVHHLLGLGKAHTQHTIELGNNGTIWNGLTRLVLIHDHTLLIDLSCKL